MYKLNCTIAYHFGGAVDICTAERQQDVDYEGNVCGNLHCVGSRKLVLQRLRMLLLVDVHGNGTREKCEIDGQYEHCYHEHQYHDNFPAQP